MRKLIWTSLFAASFLLGCNQPETTFTSSATPTEAPNDIVMGSIALDLKDGLSSSDIKDMSKEYGITIRDSSPLAHDLGNLEIADVDIEQEPNILDKLSRDPRVEIAEPTMLVHALYEPNDPLYKDQWGMKTVGATDAWSYATGRGVTVSIIDTGVDETVPDLKGVSFVPGYNFSEGNKNTNDRQSHGTHVCSTVVEVSNNGIGGIGLAPNVRIMPVKALSDSGSGTMEGVASSIIFAVNNGANVINMSLGSPAKSAVVAKAVKYAYEHGVFVAVAAGNDASPIQGSPSSDFGAFAVSAVDQQGNLAKFSSYGKEVKIAAPGVDILQSTVSRDGKGAPVYSKYSGTSMATPFITATAALLYSQGITDPDKTLETMQSSAVQKSEQTKFGAGIVDAAATTKSVYLNHTLFRAGFLAFFVFVLLTILKKNNQTLVTGTPKIAGFVSAIATSVGTFFFLPLLGVIPYLGSFSWLGELLSRPLGDWDLIWHTNVHQWLPLATTLPAITVTAFGFHRPIFRAIAGGLAVGTAAYLAQTAYAGEVQFIFGTFLMRVWAMVNVVACLWIAKNTLAAK